MNRKLFARELSGLLGILALSVAAVGISAPSIYAQAPAAAPQAAPATAADMKGKTAEQYYKKIEVLKGIPAEQVHPAMEYITTALGVGCGYCHVAGGKFDLDDKREKHVARSMIQMTMALNSTVFDGKREITCYTCHRGVAKAAGTMLLAGDKAPTEKSAMDIFPTLATKDFSSIDANMSPSKAPATIISGPAPAAAPKPAAAPLPSVADVFGKYEAALGGKPAIDKITALNFKGTVDMLVPPPPGPPGTPPAPAAMGTVPAEHDVKGVKGILSWTFPGRPTVSIGYDGNVGWHNAPNREDAADEKRMVAEWGEKFPGLEFRDNHTNVQVDAMEKVGDRDTFRVVGTRKEGFPVIDRLNFDAQTGLLVKSYTTMQSVIGAYPEDTYFEDYRDVNGVKVPSTVRVLGAEGNQTFKWAQIDANSPAEDAKFAKPVPPAPRPAGD